MKEGQMQLIADFIDKAINNRNNHEKLREVREDVLDLTKRFPLYPEIK
jgi:glycine/serine hydroxymethyltransferase